MNQYLYPWYDKKGHIQIGSIYARSFTDCVEKLSEYLIDKYNKLDDTLEFDDLLKQLSKIYGIHIGDIYDITEF